MRAHRTHSSRYLILFVFLVLPLQTVQGQDDAYADPLRFLKWPVQDVGALAGVVDGRGRAALLGAGLAIYAIAQRDPGLREAVVEGSPLSHGPMLLLIEELGNARVVRPAAAMLFFGSLASSDHRFQDAAYTSLEAVIMANVLTNTLKGVFGRSRPYQDEGASAFNPFSGNTSFPSGHSTTAFAFATPWYLYYPGPLTAGFLVVTGLTALSRVVTNAHWVSDVVAGSAIGFATACVLTRSHVSRGGTEIDVSPSVGADGAGLVIVIRP